MSRTRTQHLHATILGGGYGSGACPRLLNVGIDFGDVDPLEATDLALAQAQIVDAEELRERYAIPAEPCICEPWRFPQPLQLASASPDELLAQVLLLGLCTPHYFDPRRPVLLTRASLTRRLQIYSSRGFYA